MITEKMNAEERIMAAIALEPIDRIPCIPLMDVFFPARHSGMTLAEAVEDLDKGTKAIMHLYNEVGGWDGLLLPSYTWPVAPTLSSVCIAMRWKLPGRELPIDAVPQYDEKEIFTRQDYDEIIKWGWAGFAERNWQRFWNFSLEQTLNWAKRQTAQYIKDAHAWRDMGVPSLVGAEVFSPLMFFSMKRGLVNFTKDLFEIPDKVAAAMDAVVEDFIRDTFEVISITKLPGVFLVLERGGCFYYPLKIFERFEFPFIKKMVNAFAEAGLITCLHFDQNWTLNLPYLKELPKGKCICELDGCTDIFKAKEILKDHMCIMGDVPAALTTLGKPEEVEQYCEKLIKVVGRDGGFILSTGCALPADCKFDNFKTMVQSVKKISHK